MYSGTQVCTNVPPPAFHNKFANTTHNFCHPNMPMGPYPAPYPNNMPYFLPPHSYEFSNQNACNNYNTATGQFPQNPQLFQGSRPPVDVLIPPPMNIVPSFGHYNNHFCFPPPSPSYPNSPHFVNHHFVPPNANQANYFTHPQSHSPMMNQNHSRQLNSENAHGYNRHNRKFGQEKEKLFYCSSCDKNLPSQHKYDEHIAEHVSCGLDGCTFKAHAMVVEKHIAMQHRTGLFKRIVKGNTPEEIDKWVTERKKHYPTQNKISEKQIQKEEMEKRGERYDDRQKSFNNNRRNHRESRYHQQKYAVKNSFGSNSRKFPSKTDRVQNRFTRFDNSRPTSGKKGPSKVNDEDYFFQRNLPPFRGTEFHLFRFENGHNSDLEENSIRFEAVPKTTSVTDHLTSNTLQLANSLDLIRGYDSSDCSNDDDENELKSVNTNSLLPEVRTMMESDVDSEPEECSSKLPVPDFILKDLVGSATVNKDHCTSEESALKILESKPILPHGPEIENHETSADSSKRQGRKRKKSRNGHAGNENAFEDNNKETQVVIPPRSRRYKPPTLLEKLLAPEIKRERNVILQCIRYVVRNNHFGIGSTTGGDMSDEIVQCK